MEILTGCGPKYPTVVEKIGVGVSFFQSSSQDHVIVSLTKKKYQKVLVVDNALEKWAENDASVENSRRFFVIPETAVLCLLSVFSHGI